MPLDPFSLASDIHQDISNEMLADLIRSTPARSKGLFGLSFFRSFLWAGFFVRPFTNV
jgi:hypothetical protein